MNVVFINSFLPLSTRVVIWFITSYTSSACTWVIIGVKLLVCVLIIWLLLKWLLIILNCTTFGTLNWNLHYSLIRDCLAVTRSWVAWFIPICVLLFSILSCILNVGPWCCGRWFVSQWTLTLWIRRLRPMIFLTKVALIFITIILLHFKIMSVLKLCLDLLLNHLFSIIPHITIVKYVHFIILGFIRFIASWVNMWILQRHYVWLLILMKVFAIYRLRRFVAIMILNHLTWHIILPLFLLLFSISSSLLILSIDNTLLLCISNLHCTWVKWLGLMIECMVIMNLLNIVKVKNLGYLLHFNRLKMFLFIQIFYSHMITLLLFKV